MVARLTVATAGVAVAGFVALALLHAGAHAQALPDPTRPPAALAAPAASAPAAPEALRLQSVLVGRGRPPAAVISGELVLLGGRVREARLVRVGERHVVLRGPQGDTTLRLLPAPETTP